MGRFSIENDHLKLTVDPLGAQLVSLYNKIKDRELMWQADPAFWGRTSPILFPLVGSYYNKTMRYLGKEYKSGQHGFARDMEFSPASQSGDALWFTLCSDEKTREMYPFDFKLSLGYVLNGATVKVCWRVENTGDGELYFSIGGHPAFNCDLSQAKLLFGGASSDEPVSKIIEGDGSGCLSDRTKIIRLQGGELTLTPELFDEDALIFEDRQADAVTLIDTSEGRDEKLLTLRFSAPLFGIWSPVKKNAPFVCIEPWYGRCDRVGFSGEISEREYGNTLAPGGVFDEYYEIVVGQ